MWFLSKNLSTVYNYKSCFSERRPEWKQIRDASFSKSHYIALKDWMRIFVQFPEDKLESGQWKYRSPEKHMPLEFHHHSPHIVKDQNITHTPHGVKCWLICLLRIFMETNILIPPCAVGCLKGGTITTWQSKHSSLRSVGRNSTGKCACCAFQDMDEIIVNLLVRLKRVQRENAVSLLLIFFKVQQLSR